MNQPVSYRPTLYAAFTGYVTQAIVVNLMPLFFVIFHSDYGMTYPQISSLILCNFLIQLTVDLLSVPLVARMGLRRTSVLAHLLTAAGLLATGLLPLLIDKQLIYPALLIAVILSAMGGGMIEVVLNPIVDSLPKETAGKSLSLLHSFYCWGHVAVVLLTTLLLRWIGSDHWEIIPVLWALLPVGNALAFCRVPLAPPLPEEEKTSAKAILHSKFFLLMLLLMLCSGAAEQVMAQWISLFAERGLLLSKTVGNLLGPCLFALFMGIVRLLCGMRCPPERMGKVLTVSAAACIVCYLMAALAPWPWMSLLGCALSGFTVAMMWPGMVSAAADRYPGGGTTMFALLAFFGDIGCSVGPWMAGMVLDAASAKLGGGALAEQTGLRTGILASLIFPILLLLGTVILQISGRKKKKK